MAWSEFDLDKAVWALPRERTKNGLRHDVPLSEAALAVLSGVERRPGRALLFGEGKGFFSAWSQSKRRLDARIAALRTEADPEAEPLPDWRLHDLRRSLVTSMNELGALPDVVEAVVNLRQR